MTTTTATTDTHENITAFEDASNSRWLAAKLAPARARNSAVPTEDALERIRARVFPNTAARKKHRKIAA